MKGQRTLDLNGKELTISFTFGAVEDFCEELDITFGDWQQEVFESPKNMRLFIYYMAKENHKDLEADELRDLDFFDAMGTVSGFIKEASQGMEKKLGNAAKGS